MRAIPLLVRRRGRDTKKMSRSLLCAERKRDSAQPQLMERTGWSLTSHVACERPPRLRGIRWLRDFLLTAQPPLLRRRGMILTTTIGAKLGFMTRRPPREPFLQLPWVSAFSVSARQAPAVVPLRRSGSSV